MSGLRSEAVDVVIPVHNAPELTRRCIDAVFRHLRGSVRRVWIQDDASDAETRAMLRALPYPDLHVQHASENLGFGGSVPGPSARGRDLARLLAWACRICRS